MKRLKDKQDKKEKDKDKEKEIDETLNDMAMLGNVEKLNFGIDKQKKRDRNIYTYIDNCLKSNDDQFFILGILGTYLQKIGIIPIIEKSDVTNDEEEQNYANTLLQFICNGYILKHKYILDLGLKQERVDHWYNDKDESNEFNKNLKKIIGMAFNLNENELLVKEFKKTPHQKNIQ